MPYRPNEQNIDVLFHFVAQAWPNCGTTNYTMTERHCKCVGNKSYHHHKEAENAAHMTMVLIIPWHGQRNLDIHKGLEIYGTWAMELNLLFGDLLTNCDDRRIEFVCKHQPTFMEKVCIDYQIKVQILAVNYFLYGRSLKSMFTGIFNKRIIGSNFLKISVVGDHEGVLLGNWKNYR